MIERSPYGGYSFGLDTVMCPSCGHHETHLDRVEVNTREEDAPAYTSVSVSVETGAVTHQPEPSIKVSDNRRDYTVMVFWTECPCPDFAIQFVQHKGATYVADRINP